MRRMKGLITQFHKSGVFFAEVFILVFVLFLAPTTPKVFVSTVATNGPQLLINGEPGMIKGFTFIGRLNPLKTVCTTLIGSCCAIKEQIDAWQNWGEDLLKIARDRFHANTVRIQVTKVLLDPEGPVFNATYSHEIQTAISLIRSLGMIAHVSLQWEDDQLMCKLPQGYDEQPGDPIIWRYQIIRCWKNILEPFLNDTGVLAELLNEPAIGSNCEAVLSFENWNKGFQPIVSTLRDFGSKNILIVPSPYQEHYADTTAIKGGSSIEQYPVIDPIQSLIFGMHPTPVIHGYTLPCIISYLSESDWNKWWGDLSKKMNQSIIVTEWFTGSKAACWDNTTVLYPVPAGYNASSTFQSPTIAKDFLHWVGTMKSSISGIFHFDDLGYIIQDWTGTPTNFGQNGAFSCKQQDLGPGEMIIDFFKNN
eukprot:TRINITY_DN518_c0_g1_i1.p1 TRINITY_DN518_c0_g1~~TRINITY_DN518_c0_g1_i1.p1  ORF type:complete len:421 (-),score=48.26 TRINITY_DN518_c0_g1_i1:204-1466(-)